MWRKSEEAKPASPVAEPAPPAPAPRVAALHAAAQPEGTQISRSVAIQGELSSREPVYLDGEFQGRVALEGADLTIGPNGRVRADVDARQVIVEGRLEGSVRARERLLVRRSGNFAGEALAKRVAVEEGAIFNAKVEMGQSAESVAAARAAAAAVEAYGAAPNAAS
jgi:cytoskeletal protein CcmA (bactofilin family)